MLVASSQAPLVNIQHVRPAMGVVNLTHTRASAPISACDDFIVNHLTAPSFDPKTQSTAPFSLLDSLIKQLVASNTTDPTDLFVGNIPLSVTVEQLKSFLDERGCPVKDDQLPTSRVCIDGD